MELTSRFLRPRFCLRYLHVLLTFFVFSLFLLFLHQFRPKGSEFISEVGLLTSWRGNGNLVRGEDSTTGVLPIGFSHSSMNNEKKKKRCAEDSLMLLEGIVPELPVGLGRYDNRRLLKIYDFIRVGREWEELVRHYDVCLATQSSLERIYWVPQILEHWRGPLSLAVHITSEEEWLILNLYRRFLERCFPAFQDQVSLHLAMPSVISPLCFDPAKLSEWNVTLNFEQVESHNQCNEAREYMQYLLQTFPVTHKGKLALKEVYPQNHMRNIARKACGTEWTYSSDVDIIPRNDLAEMLQSFYEFIHSEPEYCKKCAFVIPTFELDETKPFPKSKEEIVGYYNKGDARQFHGKIFDTGHRATNYRLYGWTTTNIEDGPVKISHPIMSTRTFLYEPFYVSPDSIPAFDERFLGYGFTRNSQFQEALYAGWNFTVLTPAFSIHWGLQSTKTLLSPKKDGIGRNVRQEQTAANRRLFDKILREMKLKKQERLF